MTPTTSPAKLAARTATFWIALVLIVVSPIFIAVQRVIVLENQRYEREGKIADGIVLTKSMTRAAARDSSGRRETQYAMTYRFTAADGLTFEGRQTVTAGVWDALQERGPVRIEYIASHPAINRLEGQASGFGNYVFGAIGIGALVVSVPLLLFTWRTATKKARISSQGIGVKATVIGVDETGVQVNGRRMSVVRYRYRDYGGRTHEGKSDYMPADHASSWKTGDTVLVRLDPQQPEASVWIGPA